LHLAEQGVEKLCDETLVTQTRHSRPDLTDANPGPHHGAFPALEANRKRSPRKSFDTGDKRPTKVGP